MLAVHRQKMTDQQTSPLPPKPLRKTMSFPEAVRELINGKKITKLEWNDETSYGILKEGFLMICLKGKFHRWIVSEGDLLGEDWVVVSELN